MNHITKLPPSQDHLDEDFLFTSPRSTVTDDKARWVHEETSLYLGLFSLTPALLVFQSWGILPVFVIAALALRKVWLLHQHGVEAVTLHVATWTMTVLSMSLSLFFPPLRASDSLTPYAGMIFTVALCGLMIFPLFALISLFYGMRDQTLTRKKIWGISFSSLHALSWVLIIIFVSIQGLLP